MKLSKIAKWAGLAALALACLGALILVPGRPAAAAPAVDEAPLLEQLYQRVVYALGGQQMSLDIAATVIEQVQGWIDRLDERGEDTTALQAALDAYQVSVSEAQGQHDSAAAILAAHAGFDDDGHVTNRVDAWQTVRSATRELRSAGQTLHTAAQTLRQVAADWRADHRP